MKIDKNFYDFLVGQKENADWIKEMHQKYSDNLVCHFCQSTDTKVIVSLKFVAKCKDCGEFTEIPSHKVNLDNVDIELANEKMFQMIQTKLDT